MKILCECDICTYIWIRPDQFELYNDNDRESEEKISGFGWMQM